MKQAYPSSITAGGFAAGGSVLEHGFGKTKPYTLGVEEEYMLLDPESFDLVQHVDTFLAAVAGHELEAQMKEELMQSVLEIATPVCDTPAEVDRELRKLREYVTSVARAEVAAGRLGGHASRSAFSSASDYGARPLPRARRPDAYVARRELIFGLHVHVAVDDPDQAIQVVNGLLPTSRPPRALGELSLLAR